MEAYVNGVSTRSVDDLVGALGADVGDQEVRGVTDLRRARRDRRGVPHPPPRSHRVPLRLPRRHLPARPQPDLARSRSMAVVIATGITATGEREVLGVDVGDSEDEAFWRSFLRTLQRPRAGRGAAGDLRSARRPRRRPAPRVPRRQPSTLPRPLRPQPARPRPEVASGHGRRGVPHHLRPARPRHRRRRPGTRSATSSATASPRSPC